MVRTEKTVSYYFHLLLSLALLMLHAAASMLEVQLGFHKACKVRCLLALAIACFILFHPIPS